MITARSQILAGIQQSLGRGRLDVNALKEIQTRLNKHSSHIIPARLDLGPRGLVDLFISKAKGAGATIARIETMGSISEAVVRYLAIQNLPARLVQAPALAGVDWSLAPTMKVRSGPALDEDEISLTPAVAGVAETGTLLLASGPTSPTTLNFLPATHIVVLKRDQIVGSYEDAWSVLRLSIEEKGQPRTANFITGPSRTGDIEQKIEIGVHGPLRLHILVVER